MYLKCSRLQLITADIIIELYSFTLMERLTGHKDLQFYNLRQQESRYEN